MFVIRYSKMIKISSFRRCWQPTIRLSRGFNSQTCLSSHSASKRDFLQLDSKLKTSYDAVIIGAGHNGLIAAAYLQMSGLNVCVLERRHLVGGAAVTEEIIPGYKFSRASYLLSLMRPEIIKELELKKHGLKVYLRDPSSYTPLVGCDEAKNKSLLLGSNHNQNIQQISQFSSKDAQMYGKYEDQLNKIVESIGPLLSSPPPHIPTWLKGSLRDQWNDWPALKTLLKSVKSIGTEFGPFYELLAAPATKILDKWFESEPLKATLATDAVIGAMISPDQIGSGYVLLHHVMGELEGIKGAWGYVEGGMGAVSDSIARSAKSKGVDIFVNAPVSQILTTNDGSSKGVVLADGTEISSKIVLSNATAKVTFLDLVEQGILEQDFVKEVSKIDYTSPVTKINVAVNKLPDFAADPNNREGGPLPHHRTTIHMNCENSRLIHEAYLDAANGSYSKKPVIEMTIPSSLDPTIAPAGCHVVQLFTQYTPYSLSEQEWTSELKNAYADLVFADIEKYAPGFCDSVVGRDILTPPDLEEIFGLTGGNIFHGSMSLDQLFSFRPTSTWANYRTPVRGLYLCGSSTHPGGGVMGSPGRLCSQAVMKDWKK